MAKTLNNWLDGFVENGADPNNVTNWPENGGGAFTTLNLTSETLYQDALTAKDLGKPILLIKEDSSTQIINSISSETTPNKVIFLNKTFGIREDNSMNGYLDESNHILNTNPLVLSVLLYNNPDAASNQKRLYIIVTIHNYSHIYNSISFSKFNIYDNTTSTYIREGSIPGVYTSISFKDMASVSQIADTRYSYFRINLDDGLLDGHTLKIEFEMPYLQDHTIIMHKQTMEYTIDLSKIVYPE